MKRERPFLVEPEPAGAGMHALAPVVDVNGEAAGTGAGIQPGEWAASWALPEGMGLLRSCLPSRGRGCAERRVFEPGSNGYARGISV